MNNNDYKEALFYAASIFNERLGTEFSEDNLVLCCFQTENQQEVFEQFCKQYFPDRLEDRYTEDGYFDFHASAFVGKEDGADGILLRTDIARHPAELKHILLHELAHIFCTRNELGGDNFYERYCMDDTISREEDGTVPFPVSWTVKMKKKQKETQDILSYHTQAAGCSDKARAKASGGRQPIEECGRTGL
ncbi:MAG: hypothetical protein ACLUV5_08840 [Oscillospiraceae bacterium]